MLTPLESRFVGAGGLTTAMMIVIFLVVVGAVVGLLALAHFSREQRRS